MHMQNLFIYRQDTDKQTQGNMLKGQETLGKQNNQKLRKTSKKQKLGNMK